MAFEWEKFLDREMNRPPQAGFMFVQRDQLVSADIDVVMMINERLSLSGRLGDPICAQISPDGTTTYPLEQHLASILDSNRISRWVLPNRFSPGAHDWRRPELTNRDVRSNNNKRQGEASNGPMSTGKGGKSGERVGPEP